MDVGGNQRAASSPAPGDAPKPAAEAPSAPEGQGSQGGPEPPKTFDRSAIDAYVEQYAKHKRLVGVSLAILRNGKVVLAKGYGKRSLEAGAPVDAETTFAIGSVTKQLACASVLLLAEAGKLSIDDKVAKYYPNLTRAKDITLHDLLTHVSGYRDYYPLDYVDRRMTQPTEPDALIQAYAGAPLDFEPRTRFSYSNTGYVIAGRVVEKVSGEPLGAFLDKRIFKPLGIARSALGPRKGDANQASGYTSFALGDPEPAAPEGEGWLHAAGGIYATPSDLLKWDLALMEGTLLKPASLARMTAPARLKDGTPTTYACGLGVSQRGAETVLQHTGGVSGFLAWNAMIPRTKSAVALVSNNDAIDGATLHRALVGLVLKDQEAATAGLPKVSGPSPKEVAAEMIRAMQSGAMSAADRGKLADDFNDYLTDEKLRRAAARLKALGEPAKIDVETTWERGGMEVAAIRITWKAASARALLYRSPNGKIHQFLLYKE